MSGDGRFDLLQAGAGEDVIHHSPNSNLTNQLSDALLDGGTGNDVLYAGQYATFYTENSEFVEGEFESTGNDIILFNVGDGQDSVFAGGLSLHLSVGLLTSYEKLSLTKTGNSLILNVGSYDKITFNDWYADTQNRTKSVANLHYC